MPRNEHAVHYMMYPPSVHRLVSLFPVPAAGLSEAECSTIASSGKVDVSEHAPLTLASSADFDSLTLTSMLVSTRGADQHIKVVIPSGFPDTGSGAQRSTLKFLYNSILH